MANEVELIVDGSGALRVLGAVEKGAERAGAAVDDLNASGKQTGQAFSTGAVDRFTAAMVKMEDATRRGAAITTESVSRRTAEQKALERWQSRESEQMALQIKLRREAERAAVDMANAVRLGYTTQEAALQSLVNLERQHAAQIQGIADVQQNATKAATTAATANNTLAGSLNRVAAANDNARFASANVAAQFQDVAVTAAMGMNPLMIALQQGTQLSSVLATMQNPIRGLTAAFVSLINPVSLLTIGFVAAGAAAVQYFMSADEGARTTDDVLADHEKAIRALKGAYGEAAKGVDEYLAKTKEMAKAEVVTSGDEKTRRFDEEVRAFLASGEFLRAETQKIEDEITRVQTALGRLTIADQNAGKGFQLNAQLDELYKRLTNAGNEALVATDKFAPFRAELEAFAKSRDVIALRQDVAIRITDPSATQEVRDLGAEINRATEELFNLQSGSRAGAAALSQVEHSATTTMSSMRALGSEIAAFGKIASAVFSDVERASQLLETVKERAVSIGQVFAAFREYEAAIGRLRGNALEELGALEREVMIGGMSDRNAATTRILDKYKGIIDGLREVGASEKDVARATALMNTEIARSSAHFDELDRKAGEKGAAKAVKELNREMESFLSRADGLLEKAFPGEAARREAEELLRLLDLYGAKLDNIQRAAVQARIADQFQAAALGVRELESDTQTSGDNIKSLLGDIGNIAAGIFDGAKDSVWDWVDAIVAAIGQIGQRLMAFSADVKKTDPIAGLAAQAAIAVRAAPVAANYIGSPAHGARGASELQISAATSLARASDSLSGVTASYRNAIARIESGGRYDAIGPTNATLGRALGKYQVMEANVGPWSQQALGSRMTAREFLSNPKAQDAIFDYVFGGYVKKYGLEGAAQAWFAGPGGVGKTSRTDVLGTSVGKYGQMFVSQLDRGATGSVAANQNIAPVVAAPASSGLGTSSGSGGTFQKFAGAAGALASGFASGYQTQNPLMGAITGGLGALGTGDPLSIGLGIIGGLIGGIIGLKKAIDEARAELDKLRPEMETFFKVGAGEGVSSMAESLRQYTDQAREYAKIADKARDFETLDRLREAVVDFEETLKGDFRLGFEATLKSLSSGQGLDGELVQAQQAVLSLREELKAFIADAEFSGAGGERARQAGLQQMLATLDGGAAKLSDVEFEMQRLETVLPSVRESIKDLGGMGRSTEAVIRDRLVTAIGALRDSFEKDLASSLNDLSGRGYLNEIAAAQERYNQRLADAAALGLDATGALDELKLTLFNVMKSAGATTDELIAFGASIDGAQSSLRDFLRQAVDGAAATLRQTLDVWRDFVDGIAEYRKGLNLNPSLSTLSPAEQLAASRAAFEATAAGAAAGDRDAMGRLQSDASAYLEQAAGFWSSSEQYASIFRQVQSTLLDVETKAASEITIAEQTLAYAEQNVAGLSVANDNLMTLVQSSDALRAAVDSYLGVGGTLPMSISDMAAAAIAAAQSSTALVAQSASEIAGAVASRGSAYVPTLRETKAELERQAAARQSVQLVQEKGFFEKVGDWFADLFGFANGGAFINGMPVTAFATGGVVSSPTMFPMRNGLGLMGEAGPEAIMPLRRGSDGRLGVSAAGNDNREVVEGLRVVVETLQTEVRALAEVTARGASAEVAATREEIDALGRKIDRLVTTTRDAAERRPRNAA